MTSILSAEDIATLITFVSNSDLPDTYKMGLINRLTEVFSESGNTS